MFKKIKKEVENALNVILQGGIILYPTDTIWGIGCDSSNCHAVDKIYKIKKRKRNKPMLSLVNNVDMINDYSNQIPSNLKSILNNFEEPTTIILEDGKNLCKNLLSKNNSVAIRVVKNNFCSMLIDQLNRPIVSTSANIHKKNFPTCFKEINKTILKKVDYIVNLQEQNWSNKPSSIVKINLKGNLLKIR